MKHLRRVESEFTRQAESFASAETLGAADVTTRIAEALADLPHRRVLDLACGPSVLAPAIAPVCGAVVGVDYTARSLAVGRSRLREAAIANVHLARALAERAPFADGAFDAAVLRLALHHFDDPQAVLREAHRLLRPGGALLVLDILAAEDPEVARLHDALEILRDPSHTALVSRTRMRALLVAAGFAPEREDVFAKTRRFGEWARIIAEPSRMAALERVLEALADAGVDAGIGLRREDGEIRFRYDWGLFVARR